MIVIQDFMTTYFTELLGPLIAGYIADLALGDPHDIWHPVCFIGNMISRFENVLRRIFPKTEQGEFRGGICLVILVLFCSTAIPLCVLFVCFRLHWILGFTMEAYMCYTILATKSLKTESVKVYDALTQDGLAAGRKAVSMIVGRDTCRLDETGVVKATVETIAENTSDGVIAPMLFLFIGGPVLGYLYKAANTMDSMVGYKNEKYRYFGTAAARLDDFLNYLPSRLSAVLMIFASYLTGCRNLMKRRSGSDDSSNHDVPDGNEAIRIWKRDRRNHASPNSAQTEAVMAGALHIQLAGDAWYFGEKHKKPTIGDPLRNVEIEDILRADRLLYVTSISGMVLFCIIRILLMIIL